MDKKETQSGNYNLRVLFSVEANITIPGELITADPEDFDKVDRQVLEQICGKDLLVKTSEHSVAFDTEYLESKGITLDMTVYGDPSPMKTVSLPDWDIRESE
jgi:hypothetical protein